MARTDLDFEKFRGMLHDERQRLELDQQHLGHGGVDDSEDSQTEEVSELSGYDQHPADSATETFEREKDIAIQENVHDLLEQVNAALNKIDAGTYGLCDRCGTEISAERLEALPHAAMCVPCAEYLSGR
jgi:DnaK suppressor protein